MRSLPFLLALFLTPFAGAADFPLPPLGDCKDKPSTANLSRADNDRAEHALTVRDAEPDSLQLAEDLHILSLRQATSWNTELADASAAKSLAMLTPLPPSAALARSAHAMGRRLFEQNRCQQAERFYNAALAIARTGDPRDAEVFAIMGELAWMYRSQQQAAKAEPLYAAIVEANVAGLELGTARLFLADANYRRQAFPAAEVQVRAAIAYYSNSGQGETRSMARARLELAAVLYALGKMDAGDKERAEALYLDIRLAAAQSGRAPLNVQRPIPIVMQAKEIVSPEAAMAKALAALAPMEAQEKEIASRLALEEAAQRSRPGEDHITQLATLKSYLLEQRVYLAVGLIRVAELHHAQQQLDAAEPVYRRALGLLKGGAPSSREPWARASSDLGILLRSKGAFAEAQIVQREAYAMLLSLYGGAHPDVIESKAELAALAAAQVR